MTTLLFVLGVWLTVGVVLATIVVRKGGASRQFFEALRDVGDVVLCAVVWPVPIGFTIYRDVQRKREEAARQARITAKVADGTYTADFARSSLGWTGTWAEVDGLTDD